MKEILKNETECMRRNFVVYSLRITTLGQLKKKFPLSVHLNMTEKGIQKIAGKDVGK
jgi:hypothetical protein